jgi:hypothetical protein
MNISSLEQALLGIMAAIVAAVTPVVSSFFISHLKASKNASLSTHLSSLVSLAGTMALDVLQSLSDHNPTIQTKDQAVNIAIDALETYFTPVMNVLGLTPSNIASMVSGELTKLLGLATNADATTPSSKTIQPAGNGGEIIKPVVTSFLADGIRPQTHYRERPFDAIASVWFRSLRFLGLHRRVGWAFVIMMVFATPVMGCAQLGLVPVTSSATAVADAETALSDLNAALSVYEALTSSSPAIVAEVESYISQAQKIITDYQSGVSSSFNLSSVTALIEDGIAVLDHVQSATKGPAAVTPTELSFDSRLASAHADLARLHSD